MELRRLDAAALLLRTLHGAGGRQGWKERMKSASRPPGRWIVFAVLRRSLPPTGADGAGLIAVMTAASLRDTPLRCPSYELCNTYCKSRLGGPQTYRPRRIDRPRAKKLLDPSVPGESEGDLGPLPGELELGLRAHVALRQDSESTDRNQTVDCCGRAGAAVPVFGEGGPSIGLVARQAGEPILPWGPGPASG